MQRSPIIPITRHIVLISGFRQRYGRATTGLDNLWREIWAEAAGPDCCVWSKCWDDDFRALAAQVDQCRDHCSVSVDVAAYSWGVGHGAMSFARELQQYGLEVQRLFAIDGVYRHWIPLRSMFSRGNPLAPKIVLPHNVRETTYWRQTRNRPQGHELIAETTGQVIKPGDGSREDGLMPTQTHQTIDNSRAIHEAIKRELLA
ncbi:hypothetical protein GYB59_00605 [bacterium]|nr:hypothetical protein [bacterium]